MVPGVALAAVALTGTFSIFAHDAKTNVIGEAFAPEAGLSLRLPLRSSDSFSFGAVAELPGGGASASELNQQLSNPVSSVWSISNKFNNFELESGHWNSNWNFQPVLPVSLTKDCNLITRPVMPFYNRKGVVDQSHFRSKQNYWSSNSHKQTLNCRVRMNQNHDV